MSALGKVVLLAEISSQITTQSAPDVITPAILGAILKDMVDSDYNNVDGIMIGSLTLLQYLQQQVALFISTNPNMNGLTGQFSVSLAEEQIIAISGASSNQQIVLLNETLLGAFDNGSNFNGSVYTVPAGGFTGKFQITDGEGTVKKVATGSNEQYNININKYDSAGTLLGSLGSRSFSIPTTLILGDKFYIPGFTSSIQTLSAGDRVRLDIQKDTADRGSYINLQSLMFNNIAL